MTTVFQTLLKEPQIKVDVATLAPDERMAVERIAVNGTVGVTRRNSAGNFTSVFYILGDEKRAAERFVEENYEQLQKLDFSRRNPISTSVDRDVYDWILHALGERELEVYETVVVERRQNGVIWCIGRATYEQTPMRRYTESGSGSAKVENKTLRELYDAAANPVTESAIEADQATRGDSRIILDVFRQSSAFDCRPVTIGTELAVRKRY